MLVLLVDVGLLDVKAALLMTKKEKTKNEWVKAIIKHSSATVLNKL